MVDLSPGGTGGHPGAVGVAPVGAPAARRVLPTLHAGGQGLALRGFLRNALIWPAICRTRRPCRRCRRTSPVARGPRTVPARDAGTHARLPHALPARARWRARASASSFSRRRRSFPRPCARPLPPAGGARRQAGPPRQRAGLRAASSRGELLGALTLEALTLSVPLGFPEGLGLPLFFRGPCGARLRGPHGTSRLPRSVTIGLAQSCSAILRVGSIGGTYGPSGALLLQPPASTTTRRAVAFVLIHGSPFEAQGYARRARCAATQSAHPF